MWWLMVVAFKLKELRSDGMNFRAVVVVEVIVVVVLHQLQFHPPPLLDDDNFLCTIMHSL